MRLVLVRHAETEAAAQGRCYGTLDVALSPAGREQCAALAGALAGEPVAAVLSSPRIRAVETAQTVAARHDLGVRLDARLAELDFGELEGRGYDEIARTRPELYNAWMTEPTRVQFPGGESYADLHARSVAAVASLLDEHAGHTVVAVTHGGVVRAVLSHVLGIPDDRIFRIAVAPASSSVVEWSDGVPLVTAVNVRR
jgi:alpha-ribazole phosphatase